MKTNMGQAGSEMCCVCTESPKLHTSPTCMTQSAPEDKSVGRPWHGTARVLYTGRFHGKHRDNHPMKDTSIELRPRVLCNPRTFASKAASNDGHSWIALQTPSQMLQSLALQRSTQGPLITLHAAPSHNAMRQNIPFHPGPLIFPAAPRLQGCPKPLPCLHCITNPFPDVVKYGPSLHYTT